MSPTSGEVVVRVDFNADKEIGGDECSNEDDDGAVEGGDDVEALEDTDLHTDICVTGRNTCTMAEVACELLVVAASSWSRCAWLASRHSRGCTCNEHIRIV